MKIMSTTTQLKKPLVWMEINTQALKKNVQTMKQFIGNTKIMAVVKANAYGLGSVGVARTIEENVDAFGVVGVAEALSLRAGGVQKTIVNLGIYTSEDAGALIENDIAPSLFTSGDFDNFNRQAKKMNRRVPVWIKVDTGLVRLGIPYQEAAAWIKKANAYPSITLAGVSSTLSEDISFDQEQLQRFLSVREACGKENILVPIWSIGSSESVFLFPEANLDMMRLGISLLGYYPSEGARATKKVILEPTVTYKTRVACIKEIEAGEGMFYRQTYVAKQKKRIAILLPGYSYGLDPKLVNGGSVLIKGKKYPLVGGISATNCFADVGLEDDVAVNDEVVIFGKQNEAEIPLEDVCRLTNQNVYQCLSRIPEKVQRLYV
ncbi:MAG TPA: alanine racemase [Candidatus Magasanikbacteria bacterium]|nr:alanine racemase [Candidatus Magasanikbacteria bacterium]